MSEHEPLSVEQLCRHCEAGIFEFETTEDLAPLEGVFGQDRAVAALRFGVGMKGQDYNVFALGPSGVGKHTVVMRELAALANARPAPSDWVYVHNFDQPHRPHAIELPTGLGRALKADMAQLVEELRVAIPAAFETEEFRARKDALEEEAKRPHDLAFEELQHQAEKEKVALLKTPAGVALAPIRGGEVLGPEDFDKLPPDEQERIKKVVEQIQARLKELIRRVPQWEAERRKKLQALIREVTTYAVEHQIDELDGKYREHERVLTYLAAIKSEILDNVEDFLEGRESPEHAKDKTRFRRYEVNVFVDHFEAKGAPVIHEDHPTMQNLVGRTEHASVLGTLVTDFTLIKPGAAHLANGGYLVLDVRSVLSQPRSWEALKRTLQSKEIRIESLGQELGLVSTQSLEPESIPIDLKVVLLGDRRLYYLLSAVDPDFAELFKVPADFDQEVEWSAENAQSFACYLARLIRDDQLQPFARSAVARSLEWASRDAEDSNKISIHHRRLRDLLREADQLATNAGARVVNADHVQSAIDARTYRSDRVRDRGYEMIDRKLVLIDTAGSKVGQVNGLSVLDLGGFRFGKPSRITARARLGRGRVVDIEREVELGGPIHSKGVYILQGFVAGRFVPDRPLSLEATLVFEQSYGGVEGDSASSAELYALLSALSGVPLRQSIAVTGSVNQLGQVQVIGGVNEKIEGFFDICARSGLSGEQGVLIPKGNVQHLMLARRVIDAVREEKFHVFAVETIDEGIEILTGVAAGERGADGRFPASTINAKVEERLMAYSEAARDFASSKSKEDKG